MEFTIDLLISRPTQIKFYTKHDNSNVNYSQGQILRACLGTANFQTYQLPVIFVETMAHYWTCARYQIKKNKENMNKYKTKVNINLIKVNPEQFIFLAIK